MLYAFLKNSTGLVTGLKIQIVTFIPGPYLFPLPNYRKCSEHVTGQIHVSGDCRSVSAQLKASPCYSMNMSNVPAGHINL